MLLAGDVGGTKTLLGLFRAGAPRPAPVVVREYATPEFETLDEVVEIFLEDTGSPEVEAVSIGAAGPVIGLTARLSSTPFVADLAEVIDRLGDCPGALLNDLEAMAYSIGVLDDDELAVLQEGVPSADGNAALIAAGTGLGEALLHNVNGRLVPSASEGGHADFAARTPRELAFVQELTRRAGRVDVERVLSGRGLVNLFRFTHASEDLARACRTIGPEVDARELPAEITAVAMARRCEQCVEALEMFVEAYGAEAGNLALRAFASGGVYLGGGIAPKILPALEEAAFLEAFCEKDPMTEWLRTVPVFVVMNPSAALLGAAVRASMLVG